MLGIIPNLPSFIRAPLDMFGMTAYLEKYVNKEEYEREKKKISKEIKEQEKILE